MAHLDSFTEPSCPDSLSGLSEVMIPVLLPVRPVGPRTSRPPGSALFPWCTKQDSKTIYPMGDSNGCETRTGLCSAESLVPWIEIISRKCAKWINMIDPMSILISSSDISCIFDAFPARYNVKTSSYQKC